MPNENKDALCKLQKITKEKFPLCVINILKICGFETIGSLSSLNENVIKDIESYVNEDDEIFAAVKNQCVSYKHQTKFRLLPGHKILLITSSLKLKTAIEVLSTKRKCTNRKENKENETIDGNNEDTAELRKALLDKILQYCEKKQVPINKNDFPKEMIEDLEVDSGLTQIYGYKCASCIVKCPLCTKKYAVRFKRYWYSSTLEKHLRTHLGKAEIEAANEDLDGAGIGEIPNTSTENGFQFGTMNITSSQLMAMPITFIPNSCEFTLNGKRKPKKDTPLPILYFFNIHSCSNGNKQHIEHCEHLISETSFKCQQQHKNYGRRNIFQ